MPAGTLGWGLLTSSDGVTWQAVDMQKAFGNAVIWNVSGGSSGFVAVDTIGSAAWTSRDGQNWQPTNLDAAAFASSRIDDGTAFSAGYVLVGSTELTGARSCAAMVADPSASPTPDAPAQSAGGLVVVRWSQLGQGRVAGPQTPYIQMSVQPPGRPHSGGVRTTSTTLRHVWVSSDGRTWKPLAQPVTLDRSGRPSLGTLFPQTDGQAWDPASGAARHPRRSVCGRNVAVDLDRRRAGDPNPERRSTALRFGTDWTVGPTGVVVTDAGRLWIGLPSEG